MTDFPYLGHTAIPNLKKPSMTFSDGYPKTVQCKNPWGLKKCQGVVSKRAPNQKELCEVCLKKWKVKVEAPKKKAYQKKYQRKVTAKRRAAREQTT